MAIRIKDFMNWQTGFFVFVILVVIVIGVSMSSENNLFSTSDDTNEANQKLMIVDQGTGEISFINKSLQGINKDFTDENAIVVNALKKLLGNNMNNFGGYTKTGNRGVLAKMASAANAAATAADEKYATKTYVDTELGKKEGNVDWSNYLTYGSSVSLRIKNHVLADQDCMGFPNRSDDDWNWEHSAMWCRLDDDTKPSSVALARPGT